ncbi:MAG: cytochrome c maturation protein CcmE [Thermoanaerobaculales bacterium]|nr:cytochrome c maturation protein CcmE [Thermoanaerobaculales bacterium]
MGDPRKQRKMWYAVGGVLVVAFVVVGATSFKANLTPYVDFEQAMSTSSKVQVAGGLVEDSSVYVDDHQELFFKIVDEEGTEMVVRYGGVKPANFEEATQIVAVGAWQEDAFYAERLLVKCPSKYQGVDSDVTKHDGEA